MSGDGYVVLDTKAFDLALSQKQSLIDKYEALNQRYDAIVSSLAANWKGKGAAAFLADARTVEETTGAPPLFSQRTFHRS